MPWGVEHSWEIGVSESLVYKSVWHRGKCGCRATLLMCLWIWHHP